MNKLLISLVFLVSCPVCYLCAEDWYSEYWQQFFWTMWKNDACRFGTYVRIDTGNHFKQIRSMQLNEQFQWRVSKNIALELHYAYLKGRAIVQNSPWRWQHRLELEANFFAHMSSHFLIQTRNRLEIVKEEDERDLIYRLRQRTTVVVPCKKWHALKSLSVFNELFYNCSTSAFIQDRLCPCQLTFSISDKLDLDLFFLVRFFDVDNAWKKSAVLGTQLSF